MSGRIIQVIPRTDFAFNLPANGTQEVFLGERGYDMRDWVSGIFPVLLHAKNFTASASAFADFNVYNSFFDPQDPTVLWANAAAAAPGKASVANGDVAPLLYTAALTSPIGAYGRCSLLFNQGANTGACTLTASVYLLGRDA